MIQYFTPELMTRGVVIQKYAYDTTNEKASEGANTFHYKILSP